MANPTISVAMAVYNGTAYLREAVESILKQTFTDFEFLIIDDGSTDQSLAILQEYAAKDERIRLISRPNTGLATALNEILRLAQGKFIARMDGDDIAMPDRFALQVEFLNQHPEVVCVGGSYEMIGERGEFLNLVRSPEKDAEIQQCLLSGSTAIQHPCAMGRREAMLQVGGYNETMKASIDLDLWLRMGEVGKLANLDKIILKYRIHGNSISERSAKRQRQDGREACERAWQRRGIQGSYQVPHSWRHEFLLECGWNALNQEHRQACINFGLRAVRSLPLNVESWRLLVCALIKPLPKITRHD